MKKFLACLLSFVMVFAIAFPSYAEETQSSVDQNPSETADAVTENAESETTDEPSGSSSETTANRRILFDADSYTVYKGKQAKAVATVEVLSEDAPKKTALVWTSSDPAIVTVTAAGALAGKAAGKATITATAKDDPSITASVEIEVRIPVQSVLINEKTPTVIIGADESAAKLQLTTTVKPADAYYQTGKWESASPAIASVDENGVVQGHTAGTAKITFTSDDPSSPKKAQISVKVNQAVKQIQLSTRSLNLDVGQSASIKFEAKPKSAANKKVTWSSSNERVATVSATGAVKAIGKGTATITCTAADGSGVSAQCQVEVISMIKSIKPNGKNRVVVFAGKSETLRVSLTPSNPSIKTLKWTSSDSRVATVDSSGSVSGKSKGKCTITAAATDGSGKKTDFTVIVEPALPITLESLGFGIFMPNLMGQTVKNHCQTMTITNYSFDITLHTGWGTESGSYNLGKDVRIGPGAKKTIKRSHFGVGYASKVTITITGVTFSDGTYYNIPSSLQETWTFSR